MKRFALLLVAALLSTHTTLWSQTTYTWTGGASGSWALATNWTSLASSPRTSPAPNDILIVNSTATITNVPSETIGQLRIINGASVSLGSSGSQILTVASIDIDNGSTMKLNGHAGITDNLSLAVNSGTIEVTSGGLDIHGNTLTLNNSTLHVYADGEIFDSYGDPPGSVVTMGSCTILQEGYFSVPLHVSSGGTTHASSGLAPGESKALQGSGKGVAPMQSMTSALKDRSAQNNSAMGTASLFATFDGEVTVDHGAILHINDRETFAAAGDVTIVGTLQGETPNSVFELDARWIVVGDETYMGYISLATINIIDGDTHMIEGLGDFTESTINVDNCSAMQLSNDLTVKGGTLQVASGEVDIYGNDLTLDGGTLDIRSDGEVYNSGSSEFGVWTKGNSTIRQNGYFSPKLVVVSDLTLAGTQTSPRLSPTPSAKTLVRRKAHVAAQLQKNKSTKMGIALDGVGYFDGDITVQSLGTLQVPSDQSITAAANVDVEGTVSGPGQFIYAGYGDYDYEFKNNGTVSAPAIFSSLVSYSYIVGEGVWSHLTFEAGSEVDLYETVTLKDPSNVTNHGMLYIYSYAFKLQGGSFTNASGASVEGNFDSFETEGTVTIDNQNGGTFDETLVVNNGITTAHGVFLEPIIVKHEGTLTVLASDTLESWSDINVDSYADDVEGTGLTKSRTEHTTTVADYGKINGSGTLAVKGHNASFMNDGLVYVATTFYGDEDTKYLEGDGSWRSLTLASGSSTEVCGDLTFTGAPTPFVVNGNVTLDEGTTVTYGGTSAQNIATLTYSNLSIANSSGVTLLASTEVDGSLVVSSGNLSTGGHTLTLGTYAPITETSPFSVLGTLYTARACTTETKQDYGGLGVEITQTTSTYSVDAPITRVTGTAPTIGGVTSIRRYYDISPSLNTGLNATFVFHYTTGELNGAAESGLRLYKSTGGGTTWTDQGGTVNTTAHTITLTGVNSFSRWTAAQAGPVLPTLTNVNPGLSSLGSRILLDLTGTNFDAGSSVSFSGTGISINSVVVNSSTDLTADISISNTAPLGYRTVTVSNASGTASITNGFQVVYPAPTLSGISTSTAHRGDVLSVILTGSNFISGITSIDFGSGIAADSISVLSATQLRARISVSASASTGPRGISVTNPSPGGGTATLTGGFTVTNPAAGIVSVTPTVGGRGVTTPVVITGSGFIQSVTSVDFGAGTSVSAIVVSSTTKMTASIFATRDAIAGSRNVTVSNPGPGGGSATLAGGFTVQNPVPSVTAVSPNTGVLGQTLNVTVTGVGFLVGGTTIDFGPDITVISATADTGGTHITASIKIAAGAVAGDRTVTATNPGPGGGPGTLPGGFTVTNPAPTLSSINPAVGGKGQTLNVALVGTNFINGTTSASFGPGVTVNSAIVSSPTSLTANITIAPDAVAAARSVAVTNPTPGGGTATLSFAFNVQNAAPTLTSVSPSSGTRSQTLNVTLSGTGFYAGVTTVSSGPGITINSTTVNSLTQMTVGITVAPDAAIGPRDVAVANPAPGGGTATLTGSFTVAYPAPTLASLSPNSATRSQTPSVILTGTGFYSGVSTVSFGAGISVISTAVNSLTQMTVGISVASDAAMGPRDVAVTNPSPGGGTATLAGSFTVANPVPTITSVTPVSAGRGSLLKVTVAGTQFIDGVTSLSFGTDISVTNFSVKSSTEIQANIAINPAATPGTRTVTVTNAAPGGGPASLTNGFTITSAPATSIEGELGIIPDQYALQEAYPNPFNPSTRIRYGVPENSRIRLIVHNMLGNVVAELINGERSKGTYELQWHADNLPSGVYLIRMNAESLESTKRFIASRKVVLVK